MQKDCWEQSLLCRSPADGELKNLAAHRFFIFRPYGQAEDKGSRSAAP